LESSLHEHAIDALFGLLKEHYQNVPNDSLSHQIESQRQRGKRNVYLRFVEDEGSWVVIKPTAEIRRRKTDH
jgi:hypothetical protein